MKLQTSYRSTINHFAALLITFFPLISVLSLPLAFAETFECAYSSAPSVRAFRLVLSNSASTAKVYEFGELDRHADATGWNLIPGVTTLLREKDEEGYTAKARIENSANPEPSDWSKIQSCFYTTTLTVFTLDYTLSGVKARMQSFPKFYLNPRFKECQVPEFSRTDSTELNCTFSSFND